MAIGQRRITDQCLITAPRLFIVMNIVTIMNVKMSTDIVIEVKL
jgi:hypothetical protein